MTEQSLKKSNLAVLLVALIVFALDQISKWLVLYYFANANTTEMAVLPFFNLVLVKNTGISFGMLADNNISAWFFIFLTAIISLFLLIWLWRSHETFLKLALALALAGGLGNGLDRVQHGGVIDFLDFHIMGWHYPSFNIADCAIVIAVIMLLVQTFRPNNIKK